MNSLKQRNEKGFTIIEVVLVLAIAGLIFLIVFLALPALQRSRRDTQRKNDAGRFLAALENFAGNNNGAYPTDNAAGFNDVVTRYLGGSASFVDPSGPAYAFSNTDPDAAGEVRYADRSRCNGQVLAGTSNDRDVAVLVFQESGGTYCQDNQ